MRKWKYWLALVLALIVLIGLNFVCFSSNCLGWQMWETERPLILILEIVLLISDIAIPASLVYGIFKDEPLPFYGDMMDYASVMKQLSVMKVKEGKAEKEALETQIAAFEKQLEICTKAVRSQLKGNEAQKDLDLLEKEKRAFYDKARHVIRYIEQLDSARNRQTEAVITRGMQDMKTMTETLEQTGKDMTDPKKRKQAFARLEKKWKAAK